MSIHAPKTHIFEHMLRLLLIFLMVSLGLQAQVLPKEGSVLNFRLAGFTTGAGRDSNGYILEIAKGYFNSSDSFKKRVFKVVNSKTDRFFIELPSFGTPYTWRISTAHNTASATKAVLHHFSTGVVPNVDTAIARLRILKSAVAYQGAYVFVESSKALYNMDGAPVWYLPSNFGDEQKKIRDFKLTPQATITFLSGDMIYEVNGNGSKLWQGPNKGEVSGDTAEFYHNEFTRMPNGHYWALGRENVTVASELPRRYEMKPLALDPKKKPDSTNSMRVTLPFATLIEYDENGKIVWSWRAAKYYAANDRYFYKVKGELAGLDFHDNAFYFDNNNKVIYLSFKNTSSVVEIGYPEGNVIRSIGELSKPYASTRIGTLFTGQHNCGISRKGYLMIFNNNDTIGVTQPSVQLWQVPKSGSLPAKKIWEYRCTIEDPAPFAARQNFSGVFYQTSGGSVMDISDSSLFVCMNDVYSKMFIINLNKEILWSGVAETWNSEEKRWQTSTQYRSSIVTDKSRIEDLIWKAEE